MDFQQEGEKNYSDRTDSPPKMPQQPSNKGDQQKCPVCQTSFHRVEHLKRHLALHTGEKQYQCTCGRAFSRSDALSRHLKVCSLGSGSAKVIQTKRTEKQTRNKRACDQCARSKLKCDFRFPCSRCCSKSITCEFAREGHHDPYSSFSVRQPQNAESQGRLGVPESLQSPSDDHHPQQQQQLIEFPLSPADSNVQSVHIVDLDYQLRNQLTVQAHASNTASESVSTQSLHDPAILNCSKVDSTTFNIDYEDYFEDVDFILSEMTDQPEPFVVPHMPFITVQDDDMTNVFQRIPVPPLPVSDGFSIAQMDPVEAKCQEIKHILENSKPGLSSEIISTCITRRNLLLCSQLYGKHFQRNFPIIHSPSFKLVDATPILALAIMLTGACYSEGLIPMDYVTKLAMQLLAVIMTQPHEYDMKMPAIATIQASTIITSVLVCSRNEQAYKFVTPHTARNISMVERACFASSLETIDYSTMAEEDFDWLLWIDQESRRRLACEIFCQDMISCVFQGRSPALIPLEVNLILPSYESCWEAQTASECFRLLQQLPPQMSISTAMRHLRCWSGVKPTPFEASGFGMSVLITGLHALVFQATQYDMDSSVIVPERPSGNIISAFGPETTSDPLSSLRHDLSGPTVAALADDAASSHGSSLLRQVNNALNAWRTTWDLRYYRDITHENCSFSGDPLPLWWLAKLYIALHIHVPSAPEHNEFTCSRVKGIDEHQKIVVQSKIIRWLSRFRGRRATPDSLAESVLPTLMRPRSVDGD